MKVKEGVKLLTLSEVRKGMEGVLHTTAVMKDRTSYYGSTNASALSIYGFAPEELVTVTYHSREYGEAGLMKKGIPASVVLRFDSLHNPPCFEQREITPEEVEALIEKALTKDRGKFISSLPVRPQDQTGSSAIGYTGSDPEVFIAEKSGKIIPAFDVLGNKPKTNGYASVHTFWDGYQGEMSVPACTCHEGLMAHISTGLQRILEQAQLKNPNAALSWAPEVEIPLSVLASAEDKHAALGCDPSQNVYGVPGLQVDNPRMLPWRFAGCHMHFSTKQKSEKQVADTVKAMDAIGGVTLTSVLQGMETDVRRRYYGRAGEYRLPKHGIEYRTPSAAVLATAPLAYLAFDLVRFAFGIGQMGLNRIWDASEEETQDAINNVDVNLAKKIIRRNKDVLLAWAAKRYHFHGDAQSSKFMTFATKGARNFMDIDVGTKQIKLKPAWGMNGYGIQRFETFMYGMK